MNRKQRRAAMQQGETDFFHSHILKLPKVQPGAALERGRVYHLVCHHDHWCAIYDGRGCNCNPIQEYYGPEPVR
jgi:hypothetical protein